MMKKHPPQMAGIENFTEQMLGLSPLENLAYIRILQQRAFEEGNLRAEIKLQEMFLKDGRAFLSSGLTTEKILEHLVTLEEKHLMDFMEKLSEKIGTASCLKEKNMV